MDLAEIAKGLTAAIYGAEDVDEAVIGQWRRLFWAEIEREDDPALLENIVLQDEKWQMPIPERFAVLRKGKMLGAKSPRFLSDYYFFLSAHLDPGPERDACAMMLQELQQVSAREAQ